MAAEVPVSVVLCEAMEYLSKLGANLRTRSENLKDKKINKEKLKNAHAVHKAASKVLLICELSKKSLENVENSVQKVISRVDASQAPPHVGGKSQEKTKFYYFDYDTHKLRISKKISIKHYTSAKVVAKSMSISMHDNYPVFYDCKLKQLRVGTSSSKRRKLRNSDSETIQDNISDSNQIVNVESDDSGSKQGENSSEVINTADCRNAQSNKRKSLKTKSTINSEDDIVPSVLKSLKSDSNENSTRKLGSGEESTTENNVDKTKSSVGQHRESHSEPEDENNTSKEMSKKQSQKGGSITIFFNQKNKRKYSKTDGQQKKSSILASDESNNEEEVENDINKVAQKENEPASCDESSNDNTEPKKKKGKNSDVSNLSSKTNDDSTKKSVQNNNQKELDDNSNGSNSKPLIRCVNITKLLKPDAVPAKSDLSAGKQSDIREHFSKKGSSQIDSKENPKIGISRHKKLIKSIIISHKSKDVWDSKCKEVRNFKPKEFTVNVERMPSLTTKFLLEHNLTKIIQGHLTVCEIGGKKGKPSKNMKDVKNALLNDSESDDSVKVQSKKVKDSLLNDSDSDKEINTNIDNSEKEKEINPASIKESLLCDSDSDNNEERVEENNRDLDGNTNNSQQEIEKDSAQNQEKSDDSSQENNGHNHDISKAEKLNNTCHDTIKAKSSLLNDSESDSEPCQKTKKERRKSTWERIKAKEILLNHSSSSENEDSAPIAIRRDSEKSRNSNSNSEKKQSKKEVVSSGKRDNSSIDQIDGTVDENSDSSVEKVRK